MKAGKVVLILIVVFYLMQWVRAGGVKTPLPATFPGLGGPGQTPLYIAAGASMLAIIVWGLMRTQRRSSDDDNEDEPPWEPAEEGDEQEDGEEQAYQPGADEEDA
jgi:hypothetical protein